MAKVHFQKIHKLSLCDVNVSYLCTYISNIFGIKRKLIKRKTPWKILPWRFPFVTGIVWRHIFMCWTQSKTLQNIFPKCLSSGVFLHDTYLAFRVRRNPKNLLRYFQIDIEVFSSSKFVKSKDRNVWIKKTQNFVNQCLNNRSIELY